MSECLKIMLHFETMVLFTVPCQGSSRFQVATHSSKSPTYSTYLQRNKSSYILSLSTHHLLLSGVVHSVVGRRPLKILFRLIQYFYTGLVTVAQVEVYTGR